MGDATLEALIPKTQELLQPLIAKPKLADKLLAKPPFRFLHDIFAALTLATGFGKGLYNDFELDSANIKEKNQKIAYLDKMIVCVGFALGKDVDVRSAKIVAGLEAENTNVFLQDLARAASNSALDWIKAVQKTLEKVPSLTPDGGSAIIPMAGAGAAAPAAEAKSSEGGSSRPSSKEKSSTPSDADKAAAAEAKAKERAKREQQAEAAAEKKEKEKTAELQRQDSETSRAKAEAKAETASAAAARKKTPPQPDNNEMDDAVQQQVRECNGDFEKTKDVIEKIISKPKMAVKLLSKPPFRFLHDIFSEITRVTGFGDGLYGAEELDSNAIKEKQPKIDYLAKIISCVSVHLNVEVEAKPAKIVAGLEPEETNKFLQLLAVACRHGSSADAVQRVLAGDTTLRAVSATTKKPSSASSSNKNSGGGSSDREATPEAKLSSRSTTPQESKSREKPSTKDPSPSGVAPGGFVASAPMKATAAAHDDNDDDGGGNGNLRFPSAANDAKGENDGDDGGGSGSQQAPGTSGGFGTSRTSRPTTARRRPPKLKENVTDVGRMLVADTKIAAVAGIMKDGDNADSDDDGDNNNNSSSRNGSRPTSSSSLSHHGAGDDGSQHGRLVREILKNEEAARKEREDDDAKESAGGPTLESETGIRLGRRKKSFKDKSNNAASSATEMNELRGNIQKICQATLPMGKAIEFVHDDLDAMAKELDKWKKEYATKCGLYEDEKKKTDEALQPLQVALLEVEEQIKEQVHKINTLKGTIAKNDEKTQKLLRMVVSA